jgi:hypothetical protein
MPAITVLGMLLKEDYCVRFKAYLVALLSRFDCFARDKFC